LALTLLWVATTLALGSAAAADIDVPVNLRMLNAARDNEWENVIKALEDGAAINARNRVGDTVLNMAARRGRLDLIEAFIAKGANVNLENLDLPTAGIQRWCERC
jgi:ankyrin repeat protein